jgi:ribosomal protein S15P/S13E
MQCRELEAVLEQEGLIPVPERARAHLAACSSCRELVADMTAIVATAHQLPAEVEPPTHIWTFLRTRLEAEGIIKVPVVVMEHGSWWESFAQLLRGRALATAGVGLLIIAAAVVQLIPSKTTTNVQNQAVAPDVYSQTALTLDQEENDLLNMHLASTSPVDASLRQNLATLDDFINECRRHLKENPQDDLAREYLYGAYQQKAELLSAMMERGGSVN